LPGWCRRARRRRLGQRTASLLLVIAAVALTAGFAPLHTTAPAGAAGVASTSSSAPPIAVKVGYVDTHHVTSWPFPSPWMGSPNTVFVGAPDSSSGGWDASALRIDNTSASPLTGVTVSVDMGGQHFALWGTNTIPAAQSLILTQTAFANFDGSDTNPAGCFGCDPTLCMSQVSNVIPVIHVTIGGVTTDYFDTGQVVNTGGVDSAGCPPTGNRNDETIGWLPVGSSGRPSDVAPTVVLRVTPTSGAPPLAVTADASGSTDPDFTKISSYRFDFGDGTPAIGPQTNATVTHTYSNAGTYPLTVTVTDSGGLSSSGFSRVVVSTSTPTTTVPPTTTTTVPPPPQSIGSVGRVASATSSSTTTRAVLTTTAAVPAGNSLIISLLLSSTTAPTTGAVSATDSAGNPYRIDQDVNDGSAGDRHLIMSGLKLAAALPAGATLTLSFPSSAEYHASVDEFSGLSARDQHVGASATATAFSAGPTPTTTQANELLFGAVGTESGTTPTFAAGWQRLGVLTVGGDYQATAFQTVSATGAYSVTGTTGGTWMAAIVTYR
jgi:PKD repeat protein